MTTEEIQRLRTQAGDSATFTQLLSDPEFKAKVDRVQAGMPDMTPFEKLKFPSAMLDIHMKQPIKNTMDSASTMIDKGMTQQQQDGVTHTPGRYQYDPNEGVTFSNILPTAGKMSYNFGKDAWDTASAILSDPGEVLKNMINPVYGAAQYGIDAVVPGQIFGDTPQKKSAYDLAHAYGLPQTVGGLVDLISGKGVQGLNEISQGFSQAGTTTYENPLSTYLLGKGVKGAVSGALRGTGALGESVAGRMTAGMDSVPLDSGVARLGQASSAVGRMGQGIQNFGIDNVAQGIKSAVPDVMQKPIEYVGGKAIDATSAIARSPLSVAKYGASQFSGLTPETMKTITQNSDLYGQAERGDMTLGTVATKLQDGIETRLKELSTNSKLYDGIRGSKVVVDLPDNGAQTILNKWGISYKDGKITVDPDVAKMHLEGGDITALETFMKEYGDSTKVSANKILNARQALDVLSKWGENKTDASTLIAKDLRHMYDTAAKGKIKGLDAIDTAYAPEVQLLNKLKSEYLQKQISPDGRLTYTLSEGALRKLYGSTNPFNDPQLARLRQIIPGIDSELRVIRALKDVEYAKGQKVGTYVRGAVLGGGVMSMNIPAIVTAIIMSPPVLVPLLKWYGTVRGMFSKTENILQKVKAGSPLTEEQRTVIGDAMRYYEQEATASRQGTTTPQGMPQETVGASPHTLPEQSPNVNTNQAPGMGQGLTGAPEETMPLSSFSPQGVADAQASQALRSKTGDPNAMVNNGVPTISPELQKKFPNFTPEEIASLTPEEKSLGMVGGSDSVGGGVDVSGLAPSLDSPTFEKGFVVGDTVTMPTGTFKVGDTIDLGMAGAPPKFPKPWKLKSAINEPSSVDGANHVTMKIEAANGKVMDFKKAEIYSPSTPSPLEPLMKEANGWDVISPQEKSLGMVGGSDSVGGGVNNLKPFIGEDGKITLYHGSSKSLKKGDLDYGTFLTNSETEALDYANMRGKGKGVVSSFKFDPSEVRLNDSTGEFQYIGKSKSLAGNKYPEQIYRAYNDVNGSNLTAKEIDAMDLQQVRGNASMGLEGGSSEFDSLVKSHPSPLTAIPKELQGLAQEAKKYKSAEEFVRSQEKMLRGSKFEGVGESPMGTFLTSDKTYAETFAKGGGKVNELFVDKGQLKVAKSLGKIDDMVAKERWEATDSLLENQFSPDLEAINRLKEKGYNAFESFDGKQLLVFDNSLIKTKSQLTDIWKKANQ